MSEPRGSDIYIITSGLQTGLHTRGRTTPKDRLREGEGKREKARERKRERGNEGWRERGSERAHVLGMLPGVHQASSNPAQLNICQFSVTSTLLHSQGGVDSVIYSFGITESLDLIRSDRKLIVDGSRGGGRRGLQKLLAWCLASITRKLSRMHLSKITKKRGCKPGPKQSARCPPPGSVGPGTGSGTGTAYRPTELPTVAPYSLPVPGFIPGAPAAAAQSAAVRCDVESHIIETIFTGAFHSDGRTAAVHARPFVGVSQSQLFRDLVNFWR